jgi:hypothetical protein
VLTVGHRRAPALTPANQGWLKVRLSRAIVVSMVVWASLVLAGQSTSGQTAPSDSAPQAPTPQSGPISAAELNPVPECDLPPGPIIPPVNYSWLKCPLNAGVFVGMLNGGPLIDDWLGQQQGIFGGLRLGYDMGERWGAEVRYAFGSVKLVDSARAYQTQQQIYGNQTIPTDISRFSDRDLLDGSILFYFTGDTRLRPYCSIGLGLTQIRFNDIFQNRTSATVPDVPLGIGLKYLCSDATALRFEVNDTIIFGGQMGFNNVHDLSLTGGVEFRFGGRRRSYWPWIPAQSGW